MRLKQPKTLVDKLMKAGEDEAMSGSYPPDECEEIRIECAAIRHDAIKYLKDLNARIRELERDKDTLSKRLEEEKVAAWIQGKAGVDLGDPV